MLEYDGSAYQGWQSQKTGCTIQDILTAVMGGITGEHVRLTGASRTDAGVHAFGQVAAFDTASGLTADVLKRAMNANLPRDIRVLSADDVVHPFHPRFDAIRKRYIYILRLGCSETAFFSRYTWHVRSALDMDAMQEAALHLAGSHDFSSFRGAGCSSRSPLRTIYEIGISVSDRLEFATVSLPGNYMKIAVEANAFLRHMVRNIVGTLVEVGRGRVPADAIPGILASRDRTIAGPTAPAAGLFLERVFY